MFSRQTPLNPRCRHFQCGWAARPPGLLLLLLLLLRERRGLHPLLVLTLRTLPSLEPGRGQGELGLGPEVGLGPEQRCHRRVRHPHLLPSQATLQLLPSLL